MLKLEDAIKGMNIDPDDLLVIMEHVKKEGDTLKGLQAYIAGIEASATEFRTQLANLGHDVSQVSGE